MLIFPAIFVILQDIEDQFIRSGLQGVDTYMFKIFMLLYADDIVIFCNNATELQSRLD